MMRKIKLVVIYYLLGPMEITSLNLIYLDRPIRSMGFLKKLKDAAGQGVGKGAELGKKGIEKGAEVGTKVYDGTKDAAQKGYDKAKENKEDKKEE